MSGRNVFYAQSGGVTSVINASAWGLIQGCRARPDTFGKVYAGREGILGALDENLIDTSLFSDDTLEGLVWTPGGAFGSCRYKLKGLEQNRTEYERLIEVFDAHEIGYFFYNGGNDSMDTAHKVSLLASELGYPLTCIGIPKTIDNDLAATDNCPGFGSVAKYIATSTAEAGFDIASMCGSSTKVFVMEVMGRHAGWIAAAAGLASEQASQPPHIILFPELTFDADDFLNEVDRCVDEYGYCVVVASEGIAYEDGSFVAETGTKDAFGHAQLGGVAPALAHMVGERTGHKYHYAIADYLQRSARHISAKTDLDQAIAVGEAAAHYAAQGMQAVMPAIIRGEGESYTWTIEPADLSDVANHEKFMPRDFITENGYGITDAARAYLAPLIEGECFPPFKQGMPEYLRLDLSRCVDKKLPPRGQ